MKQRLISLRAFGFTIIELMIVVVIIGILATIVTVAYNGIQSSARDASVLSDLDNLDGIQTQCSLNRGVDACNLGIGVYAKAWYSGSGVDSYLQFTPNDGNVIDVVVNATDYCIRGYNTGATKNSISNAAIKESSAGACVSLPPSYDASGVVVSPPTSVVATRPSNFIQIDVTWATEPQAVSYQIEFSTSPSFTAPTLISGVTGTSRSILSGLSSGTQYYIRMYSVPVSGPTSSASNTSSVTTGALSPP